MCERLFAYFRATKPRFYCNSCLPIWRKRWNVKTNEFARQQRRSARENAIEAHNAAENAA